MYQWNNTASRSNNSLTPVRTAAAGSNRAAVPFEVAVSSRSVSVGGVGVTNPAGTSREPPVSRSPSAVVIVASAAVGRSAVASGGSSRLTEAHSHGSAGSYRRATVDSW